MMEKFGSVQLKLNKAVKTGDQESLLSLFDATDRFKPIEVLSGAEEDTTVKVVLEGLGETDLKLGADMEKGRRKTIMTLFWFSERSRPFSMLKDAQPGETVTINIYKS
ncbi:MAG: hypothetical protein PHU23_04170 [Dehalococcoidales bacterium]|nr:hypothetical protein [Dehalococcoidales bacterium]